MFSVFNVLYNKSMFSVTVYSLNSTNSSGTSLTLVHSAISVYMQGSYFKGNIYKERQKVEQS